MNQKSTQRKSSLSSYRDDSRLSLKNLLKQFVSKLTIHYVNTESQQ